MNERTATGLYTLMVSIAGEHIHQRLVSE